MTFADQLFSKEGSVFNEALSSLKELARKDYNHSLKTRYLVDTENPGGNLTVIRNLIRGKKENDEIFLFITHMTATDVKDFALANPDKCHVIFSPNGQKNSLDFCLVTYLGKLIQEDNVCSYVICSDDHDYEPALDFWRKDGITIGRRSNSSIKKQQKTKQTTEKRTSDDKLHDLISPNLRSADFFCNSSDESEEPIVVSTAEMAKYQKEPETVSIPEPELPKPVIQQTQKTTKASKQVIKHPCDFKPYPFEPKVKAVSAKVGIPYDTLTAGLSSKDCFKYLRQHGIEHQPCQKMFKELNKSTRKQIKQQLQNAGWPELPVNKK